MSVERKILFCHSQRDKKWVDRLHSAISRVIGSENLALWSDTAGFGRSDSPAGTFEKALGAAPVAVVLVSENFLRSKFWGKARRPMQAAVDRGEVDLLVLPLSHCLHDLTWLRAYATIGKPDQPLDSINTVRRDAALEDVARQIAHVLSMSTDMPDLPHTRSAARPARRPETDAESDPGTKLDSDEETEADSESKLEDAAHSPASTLEGGMPTPLGGSAYARKLASFVRAQKDILLQSRRLGRILLAIALVSALGAVVLAAGNGSIELFLIVAGFGLFVASLALALAARRSLQAQRIISAQYVRVGFIDETIPSRQRAALTRKADLLLGNF